uniref:23.6 kDa heat shock protein n=1 Tax=Lygus hesperus TaxID=30085 RepID=K9MVP5_LYGHE|nr:23.6 kDa heat shock protein [Lygus hesperus]
MSLLPIVLNELLNERLNERRNPLSLGDIYDQHFGLGLEDLGLPAQRAVISVPALHAGYLRPWRNLAAGESGVSSVKSDDKEFSVRLDVTHFKPEELKVSLDDQGYVKVEGNHEERSDEHGFISRQFTRRYKLPEDALPDTLASNLSSDGVLTLQAAKKPKELKAGREIKIIRTNQPALKKEEKTPDTEEKNKKGA